MKKILTPLLIAYAGLAFAQQTPQYSLSQLNPYALNPAYAGLENSLVLTGVYRRQWLDLEGAPQTQHLNAHLPLYIIHSGVGLKLENDIVGAHRSTQAMVSYDYQLEFGRSGLVSFGLSGGFLQYVFDGSKVRAPEGTYTPDGTVQHQDPSLPDGKVQAGTPVFEAGVFLQKGKLEAGAAIQPVFAPVLEATQDQATFRLKPVSHYTFYASYRIDAGEKLAVLPSLLAKSDLASTQAEVSVMLRWNENVFIGGAYRGFGARARDAAVLLAGLKINEKTTLGYAFDLPLSALKAVNRGSHELLLRYNLNRPIGAGKLPPIINNPRFY